MNNTSYQIGHLIQKMSSSDKDFRFMATNDLLNELQKDSIKLDDDAEKKVVKTLLNLLKDSNAEVQNLAVKCLGPLINKVKEAQVDNIVETLCGNMLSNDEILKETSSIGLKTVISEIAIDSNNLISAVCKKITGQLINAVMQQNVSLQLEALDIFSDLLFRFGNVMSLYYPNIKKALFPQLNNSRTAVNKRTITCLSFMAITCSDQLYAEIMNALIAELTSGDSGKTKTYINCITAVCKHSGSRMGTYLPVIFELIIKFIETNDDDVKELCLQAFEVFVRRCPKEVSVYIEQIIKLSLKYISYDPNYNYDDDENDDEDMEMDNDVDEDNASDEDYSDDDDMSWKVRRAAAKALEAVILNRLDLLEEFYKVISPVIIGQFKVEREENVKVDIFNTYIALLRQTRAIIGNLENLEKFILILREQVPQIVRSLDRQLKEKSIKTRQSCFSLLSELVNILPNALADPENEADQKKNFLNNIIPGILYSLNSNNSTSSMKIEALAFLNILLKTHKPQVFQNYFNALITEIKKAVTDSFYKITSEALVVLTQIIPIIRPSIEVECDANVISYIDVIYSITFAKLKANDIDQEVKERAITCMAQIICTFGDYMKDNLHEAFTIFLDRLKNEVTRLTCVKALIKIANVYFKQPLNLTPLFPEAFPVLAQFLRQNKRFLKFNTLLLLDKLCKNYNDYMTPEINEVILNQMLPLISETDLYISQLALTTITSMILSHKAFSSIIPQYILPQALVLIQSPLLQGTTLNSMLDFFRAIVQSSFPGLDYNQLIVRLTQPILAPNQNNPLHKQAYYSISKCIAAISLLNGKCALATVSTLIQQVRNPSIVSSAQPESVQLYSLLTIAEIGKNLNLESLQEQLQEAIIDSFNSTNEEVKSAASVCLGSVSVGNLERYLPFVLYEISQKQKRQYLLLNALKEIISCSSIDNNMIEHLEPHLKSIWDLLIDHSQCEEEGTRYVVAECLGKLALLKPAILLQELLKNLNSPSPFVRDTVITSIRFTISESPHEIDALLKNSINDFLKTLEDSDINVRRVALITFNSTAHNKPSLIRDSLESILPLLYKETKAKQELVREVEMGPFKHTVDDGLDLRKAAFECMYTLLESCLDRIEIFEFLNQIESGLKDTYDIKMLTYLILIRLADLCPSAILQRLDSIVLLLKETCIAKLKANSVKQEHEKQDELKRSAIRAFVAIYKIPDSDKNAFANEVFNLMKNSPELKPLYESVQNSNKINSDVYSPMEIEFN